MRTEIHDGELVVTLSGDIDATTAYRPYEEVVAQFDEHDITTVVVDLADVTFADSTALGMLVRTQEHAIEHGAQYWLQHVPPPVATLLEMTGLDDTLRSKDQASG